MASIVGLVDDALVVGGWGKYIGGGISFKKRFLLVVLIGLIGSIWFYQKLGWDVVYITFVGDVSFGLWYIPFFIFLSLKFVDQKDGNHPVIKIGFIQKENGLIKNIHK